MHRPDTFQRRLALAVIRLSIDHLVQGHATTSQRRRRLYHEAREFFWGNQDRLYSAYWLCHGLGIELAYLQRGLTRLLAQPHPRRMPRSIVTTNRTRPLAGYRDLDDIASHGAAE